MASQKAVRGKKRIVPEDFEGKKTSVPRSPVMRGGKKDYRAMAGKAPRGPVRQIQILILTRVCKVLMSLMLAMCQGIRVVWR